MESTIHLASVNIAHHPLKVVSLGLSPRRGTIQPAHSVNTAQRPFKPTSQGLSPCEPTIHKEHHMARFIAFVFALIVVVAPIIASAYDGGGAD